MINIASTLVASTYYILYGSESRGNHTKGLVYTYTYANVQRTDSNTNDKTTSKNKRDFPSCGLNSVY